MYHPTICRNSSLVPGNGQYSWKKYTTLVRNFISIYFVQNKFLSKLHAPHHLLFSFHQPNGLCFHPISYVTRRFMSDWFILFSNNCDILSLWYWCYSKWQVSLSGHLFDQFLINEALDIIEAAGGSFHLVRCDLGQSANSVSYSELEVSQLFPPKNKNLLLSLVNLKVLYKTCSIIFFWQPVGNWLDRFPVLQFIYSLFKILLLIAGLLVLDVWNSCGILIVLILTICYEEIFQPQYCPMPVQHLMVLDVFWFFGCFHKFLEILEKIGYETKHPGIYY